MTLIWHLVKKDLHRLRWPVVLLSLLTAGKLGLFAMISGVFLAPDPSWLNRLQNGPELLLRNLAEPVVTYFLAGWLIFEDSPVEKDAHWLTRPISGAQLFTAKLAAAMLLFVLLPVALHVIWWLTGGLEGREIAMAVTELVIIQSILVALALACASLTDGFPRFILWSLLTVGTAAIGQALLAPLGRPGPGMVFSRMMVFGVVGAVMALTIAVHQFATGRHQRSLMFALGAFLSVQALGAAWPWDITKFKEPSATAQAERLTNVQLSIVGPARLRQAGARHFADLTLQITGIPGDATVRRITAATEWTLGGANAWNSQTNRANPAHTRDAIQRLLFPKPARQADGEVILSLPFSPKIAMRAATEPMALRASINLDVFQGKVLARLPLREVAVPPEGRAYTLSNLAIGRQKEKRRKTAADGEAPMQNAVSLLLTERTVEGLGPSAFGGSAYSVEALVNLETGEFFLADPTRSGPMAITLLDQARVACRQLTFLCGTEPVRFENFVLAIIRFGDRVSIARVIDTKPGIITESGYGVRD
jgi:hypothetical protein